MNETQIVIFGEVLFDHFPDGSRVLGGAPFNVAWHLQAFGHAPLFVSRVGDDPEGEEIRLAMRDWGMDLSGLQTDPSLPTGRVNVALADGEPIFDIMQPVAFDAIADDALDGLAPALLYHGTLAARDSGSRSTLLQLREKQPRKVFIDVNLRPPWWQHEAIRGWLRGAHWVKLSGEELREFATGAGSEAMSAADFLEMHALEGVILTHGARGAEAVVTGEERYHVEPRQGITVVDTVGAGDAFASIMILGLTRNWPTGLTLERAQAFASALCGRRGATVVDRAFYRAFSQDWRLD